MEGVPFPENSTQKVVLHNRLPNGRERPRRGMGEQMCNALQAITNVLDSNDIRYRTRLEYTWGIIGLDPSSVGFVETVLVRITGHPVMQEQHTSKTVSLYWRWTTPLPEKLLADLKEIGVVIE